MPFFSLHFVLVGAFLVIYSADVDCLSTTNTPPTKKKSSSASSSWQRRLDKAFLDIDATPESRFRNFQRALQDPNIISDVTSAIGAIRNDGFGKGHPQLINTLWPEGTIARADLEGLTALRTQIPEVLQELQKKQGRPESRRQSSEKKKNPASFQQPQSIDFNALPKLEELEQELKNSLRSTPRGLETPKYSIVRVIDGQLKLGTPERIEIRKYEAFTVATTPSVGGDGFTTLASYLFGGNEDDKSMAMTMPVVVTADQTTTDDTKGDDRSGATMQFVIPSSLSGAPPVPLPNTAVRIEQIPERLVAVKTFPGIVTEDEVARQKESLLSALREADVEGIITEDEVSVLQYNSPFTIPWRRRNEIAVVVVDTSVVAE